MKLPEIGDVFEGRYEVVSLLGVGGFARVLRARDTKLARDVALKITSPVDGEYSTRIGQRFLREAAVLAELHDPHTITLYDFGESEDGLLYMAFEFIDGEDLTAVLARGALDPATTIHILLQLLSSLREAHSRDVLHRDIKPSNVLVYEYGGDPRRVKLLDFGVAKPIAADSPKLTKTGNVIGTPRYMAPEQVFAEPLTPATDIYSLGLLAFEMLTGRPAISGKTQREILTAAVSSVPFRLPEGVASPALGRIVDKMIARRPHARYASAEDVQAALMACRGEYVVEPEPPLAPTRVDSITIEDLPPTLNDHDPLPVPTLASPPPSEPSAGNRRPLLAVLVGAGFVIAAGVLVLKGERTERTVVVPKLPVAPAVVESAPAAPEPAALAVVADVGPDATADLGRVVAATKCVDKRGYKPGITTLARGVGRQRKEVLAVVPKNYDPTKKHGLIVMYHDFEQEPRQLLDTLELDKVSDLEQFVVIAPRARHVNVTSWAGEEEWTNSLPLIGLAYNDLCIDTDRVFVVGHGSGAAPAYKAMCAGGFAGMATTSHLARSYERKMCEDVAIPYLSVTTSDDPIEPTKGGITCAMDLAPSKQKHRHEFKKRHGCNNVERRWLMGMPPECLTWGCDVPFVWCHAEGGRQWRGDKRVPSVCGSGESNFPNTRVIWRFFSQISSAKR